MNIGVFGDSFADKDAANIWWRKLKKYGHHVDSFGESGSSLGFSADLVLSNYNKYDFVIWCVTSVSRISFWYRDQLYHNTGMNLPPDSGDVFLDQKRRIIYDYISKAFDWHHQEIMAHGMLNYALSQIPNLMIIPCFDTPVYFMKKSGFNLYSVCEMEVKHYLPSRDTAYAMTHYRDLRGGHITDTNQQILVDRIAKNLKPGIFTAADLTDFAVPNDPFETVLEKI